MDFVHVKHMIGGSHDHLLPLCQYQRLENINGLSQVGHFDALTVAVEDIQHSSGHDCIPQ